MDASPSLCRVQGRPDGSVNIGDFRLDEVCKSKKKTSIAGDGLRIAYKSGRPTSLVLCMSAFAASPHLSKAKEQQKPIEVTGRPDQFGELFLPPTLWSQRFGLQFFTCEVTGAELSKKGGQKHALYKIALRCGKTEWSVKRRYSEFAALHSEVACALGLAIDDLPPLPPKTFFWEDSSSTSIINRRKVSLNLTLRESLALEGAPGVPAVRRFLDLPILNNNADSATANVA